MEKYLAQLLEDMRVAATKAPPPGPFWDGLDLTDSNDMDDLAYIEENFLGIPQPLEDILGIKQIMFPDLDKLNPAQVKLLYHGMRKLLNAYHFSLPFPRGMPMHEKYRSLCEIWDSEQVLVGAGTVEIDFCQSIFGCPFPVEFCTCKEAEEQMKWDEEQAKKYNNTSDNSNFDIRDLWPHRAMTGFSNSYPSDHVPHPGITLREKMDEAGWLSYKLAARVGESEELIESIIIGEELIGKKLAWKLELELNLPEGYWMQRQAEYLDWLRNH